MKLATLPDEELREIALKKNNKGCATRQALSAQRILLERHNSFAGISRKCNYDYAAHHGGELFDIFENMKDNM